MGTFVRLLLLLGAVFTLGVVGYTTIHQDLHETLQTLWDRVVFFFKTFDITVVIRAAMLWVKKMGTHWLMVEVPKRIIIISLLPYVILWLMPNRQRRRFRIWLMRKRLSLVATRQRFVVWLRAEHMFGDYAGWAIGLILAFVFLVFFYSAFWVYLALWLGFIKIPAFVTTSLSYLWSKLLFLAQKIPFASLLFKWVHSVSEWLSRFIPRFRMKSEEERRRRARARARYMIRKRYDKELFLRVGWHEYHRLRKVRHLKQEEPPTPTAERADNENKSP